MRRKDFEAVGVSGKSDKQRVVQIVDLFIEFGIADQVRPADVTHEQHITGKNHPRLIAA